MKKKKKKTNQISILSEMDLSTELKRKGSLNKNFLIDRLANRAGLLSYIFYIWERVRLAH